MKKLLALFIAVAISLFTLSQTNAAPMQTKPAQHLTKDGKPDKRYKENKPVLRKDGKPDMRYKTSQAAVAGKPTTTPPKATTTAKPAAAPAKTATKPAAKPVAKKG